MTEVKALDDAFARANQTLAISHHLENAGTWAGGEVIALGSAAIRDSRMLAAKLVEGSGYAVEEVGKGIDALGTAVRNLGQKLQPA